MPTAKESIVKLRCFLSNLSAPICIRLVLLKIRFRARVCRQIEEIDIHRLGDALVFGLAHHLIMIGESIEELVYALSRGHKRSVGIIRIANEGEVAVFS